MNRRHDDNLPSSKLSRWLDENERGTSIVLLVIVVVMGLVTYWRWL